MDARLRRMRTGEWLRLRRPGTLMCHAGTVRIDPPGVLLAAGGCYSFEGDAAARVCGGEGMKDEWLNDTGVSVVSLTAAEK